MRVIAMSRLREFWEQPDCEDAEASLKAWFKVVNSKQSVWYDHNDLKVTFPKASIVGNCVVFDIKGNDYRLITRVLYPSQKVLTLKVMTHKEYDRKKWYTDCGCLSVAAAKKKGKKN